MRRVQVMLWCVAIWSFGVGATIQAQSDQPRMYLSPAGPAVKTFRSGRWNMIGGEISNPTDRELELLVAVAFARKVDDKGEVTAWSNAQFGTRIWAPPYSRQSFQLLARSDSIPEPARSDAATNRARSVPVMSMLLDATGPEMAQLSRDTSAVLPARDKFITGIIRARGANDAIATAVATRKATSLSQRLNFARPDVSPDSVFGWQGMEALVLARPDLDLDSAQVRALRRWILGGGNLWVMLDKVDVEEMEALLPDDWTIDVIDRVDLNAFTLEGQDSSLDVETEVPIEMVRVLAVDMEVVHRVNGHPASLRRAAGHGKLLVTTLGPRAWVNQTQKIELETKLSGPEQSAAMAELIAAHIEPDAYIERNIRIDLADSEQVTALGELAANLPGSETERSSNEKTGKARVQPDEASGSVLVTTSADDQQLAGLANSAKEQGLEIKAQRTVAIFITTKAPHEQLTAMVAAAQEQGLPVKLYKLKAHPNRNETFTPQLKELARWFNDSSEPRLLPPYDRQKQAIQLGWPLPHLEHLLNEQIGRHIIGRGPIVAILASFCGIVLLGGMWLSKRNQLERVGWVGIGAAVVATAILLGMGARLGQGIPKTVLSGQFVQVLPEQRQAITSAVVQVFNPPQEDNFTASIQSTDGAVVWPADASASKVMVRMIQTDVSQSHWKDMSFDRDTVVQAEMMNVTDLDQSVEARVSFGPEGVTGTIETGTMGALEDVILATPTGTLPVQMSDGNQFTAGPDDMLAPSEYIRGLTLTARQDRRQNVYRKIFENRDFPRVATILGWSNSWDVGLHLPDASKDPTKPARERRNTVLVAIPVTLDSAGPMARLTIPPPLLGFRSIRRSAGGRQLDMIYTNQNRTWVGEHTQGGSFQFEYTVPEQVRPFQVESARLVANLIAERAYEIMLVPREALISAAELPIQVNKGASVVRTLAEVVELDSLGDRKTIRLRVGLKDVKTTDRVSASIDGVAFERSTANNSWLDADIPLADMRAGPNVLEITFESGQSDALSIASIEYLVLLHQADDASGETEINLDPAPQPDDKGRIVLEVRVDHAPPDSMNLWKLDGLDLTVTGHVLDQPAISEDKNKGAMNG